MQNKINQNIEEVRKEIKQQIENEQPKKNIVVKEVNRKGFPKALLFLFLALVFMGIGGYGVYYFMSRDEAEISELNTYKDKNYGFEFAYPKNLNIEEIEGSEDGIHFLKEIDIKGSENSKVIIEIRNIQEKQKELEYQKWREVGHSTDKIEKEIETKTDGFDTVALEFYPYVSENELNIKYIIFTDNHIYTIKGEGKLVDQIISTFKFNTEEQDETTDWKTYRNDEYGFEFRYPENIFVYQDLSNQSNNSINLYTKKTNSLMDGTMTNNDAWVSMDIFINETNKISYYKKLYEIKNDELYIERNVKKIKNIQTDNYKGSIVFNDIPEGFAGSPVYSYEIFWFGDSNIIYRFTLNSFDKIVLNNKYKKIFDQIFSTFKFIEREKTNYDVEKAKTALINYYKYLSEKDYLNASKYVGNKNNLYTVANLHGWCPDISLNSEVEEILECACNTLIGCELKINKVLKTEKISSNSYKFTVKHEDKDGNLFEYGPCCGATEEDIPTVREFDYVVDKQGEKYFVMDTPMYRP